MSPTDPGRPPPAEGHDEIGVAVGPDRDGYGLFDAPTTGTATRAAEPTEGPPRGPDHATDTRRTAVLAWIAARPPAPAGPTPSRPGADGVPCAPLKRLIADEPLDPLPPLDGVPLRPRPAARAAARALAPEREDTATQIEGFGAMLARRGPDGPEATGEAHGPVPAPHRAPPPAAARLRRAALALLVVGLLLAAVAALTAP